MNKTVLTALALTLAGGLLGGCSSTSEKSVASVEDKGTGGLYGDELGAGGTGVGDSAGFEGTALSGPGGEPGSPLSQRVIYFDYDSSEVPGQYRPVIEAHAAYLSSTPNALVTVEGHTDERGSREYNLALGERRAVAVRRQMVLLGASAGQVRTVSYGEERPAVEGGDEGSWAQNRRAELVY